MTASSSPKTSNLTDFQDEFTVLVAQGEVDDPLNCKILQSQLKVTSKREYLKTSANDQSSRLCPPKLCLRKLGSTSQSFTSYSPHITTSNALCTDVSENFTVHRASDDSLKLNLSGEDCDGPRRNRKAYNFQMGLLNTLEAMRLCKGDN